MSQTDEPNDPEQVARVAAIIVMVLIAGLVGFLLLVVFVVRPQMGGGPGAGPTILTYVAVVFGFLSLTGSMVAPRMAVSRRLQAMARGTETTPPRMLSGEESPPTASDANSLAAVYLTQTIIAAAFTEGAGFLGTVVYLLEGGPVPLGLAILCAILLATRVPTRDRMAQWIESRLVQLEELRRAI
jgi:amino acid transporter